MRDLQSKIKELRERYRTVMYEAPEENIRDCERFKNNNRRPRNRYNYYDFFYYSSLLGEKIVNYYIF